MFSTQQPPWQLSPWAMVVISIPRSFLKSEGSPLPLLPPWLYSSAFTGVQLSSFFGFHCEKLSWAFHVLAVMVLLPFFSPVLDKPKASLRQGKCSLLELHPWSCKRLFSKEKHSSKLKIPFRRTRALALHCSSCTISVLLYTVVHFILCVAVAEWRYLCEHESEMNS